jgi:heat shock protein HslJ
MAGVSVRTLAAAAVLLLAVAACAGPAASPPVTRSSAPVSLAGTAWTAVLVAGQPVVPASPPTATFDATEVNGTTGCNRYGGAYTYADGAITFGAMRTTLMGCIGPIGDVEIRFSQAMGAATTATMDPDGRLVLDGPGGSIVFEVSGQPAGPPPSG